MIQHIIVIIIFSACLYVVLRRVKRCFSQAKKGDIKCITCTEVSCPLHQTNQNKKCNCNGKAEVKKSDIVKKCKKT